MTAQFAGQASQLEWYVAGSHRPVLTTSAALSTLRFHQSPTGSIVGVRAIGLGGASPIVQMRVPPLPLPAGSIAKKIGSGVHAGGPVFFATSNPAFLLRNGPSAEICALTGPSRISAEGGLLDIKGCALPLQSLGQLPPSLKGIVVDMANRYHIPLNTADANLGLELSDAYRAIGQVVVNGMTINSGLDGIVIFPQVHVIAAANAKLSIGAVNLANPISGPFQIDTSPRFGRISLGTFHSLPGTVLVPGFAVVGDVSVTAVPPSGNEPAGTAITAKLQLPSWLSVGGVSADATVDLRATTDSGLMLDSMQTRVQNLNIGPVQIRSFQIKYTRAPGSGLPGDRWEGQGVACVPFGGCIDMAPPHGGVRIVDGQPDFIGASLQFNPHLTLFPGIDLSEIGFAFGQNPTRFLVTTAEVFASDILRLDGRIVVAFPGAGDPPYTLRQDAAFLDPPGTPSPFSPAQYGIPHSAFTLAASVQAALTLPVVGDVPVGNAYFIYEYPGYIAFGGGIPGQSLLGLGQVSGGVSGEVNFTNGRYDIFGNINVCTGIDCPNGILTVSYGGDVNFSDVGMSVCVRPSVFPDFGIGIYWPGRFPTDWHFQGPGCRWSPYADKNVHGSADGAGARAVAASLPYRFTVHRRDAGLSIQLAGTGGAPRVRVIAPGGRTIDSPAGDGVVGTQRLMIVRFDRMQITSVGMRHGVPGTYRIVALPGSVPVSQIATATPLPDAKITASVHGQGTHRILSYDIARASRTAGTVPRAHRERRRTDDRDRHQIGARKPAVHDRAGHRNPIDRRAVRARSPARRAHNRRTLPPAVAASRGHQVTARRPPRHQHPDELGCGAWRIRVRDGAHNRRLDPATHTRPRHGGHAARRRQVDRRPRQRPRRRHASGGTDGQRPLQSHRQSADPLRTGSESPTVALRTSGGDWLKVPDNDPWHSSPCHSARRRTSGASSTLGWRFDPAKRQLRASGSMRRPRARAYAARRRRWSLSGLASTGRTRDRRSTRCITESLCWPERREPFSLSPHPDAAVARQRPFRRKRRHRPADLRRPPGSPGRPPRRSPPA